MSIPSLLQKRERERGSKTARGFVRERGRERGIAEGELFTMPLGQGVREGDVTCPLSILYIELLKEKP